MEQVDKALEDFIKAIKYTKIYTEYEEQKEHIKNYPDLKQRIDEFRERNYLLHNSGDTSNLFEEMDRFHEEYEQFQEIPMVHDFLEKELAYCRMLQYINEKVVWAFEADFE